jgi:hypothetical protein
MRAAWQWHSAGVSDTQRITKKHRKLHFLSPFLAFSYVTKKKKVFYIYKNQKKKIKKTIIIILKKSPTLPRDPKNAAKAKARLKNDNFM